MLLSLVEGDKDILPNFNYLGLLFPYSLSASDRVFLTVSAATIMLLLRTASRKTALRC